MTRFYGSYNQSREQKGNQKRVVDEGEGRERERERERDHYGWMKL